MTGSDELEVSFTEKFTNANPYNRILPKPWKPKEFLSVVKNIVEDKIKIIAAETGQYCTPIRAFSRNSIALPSIF